MSDLLWQKPGVKVDARIQAFLAGEIERWKKVVKDAEIKPQN